MSNKEGKKTIHVEVPAKLHDMIAKIAIDEGLTMTSVIVQYLEFLRAKYYKKRKPINEHTESDFKLDARPPK